MLRAATAVLHSIVRHITTNKPRKLFSSKTIASKLRESLGWSSTVMYGRSTQAVPLRSGLRATPLVRSLSSRRTSCRGTELRCFCLAATLEISECGRGLVFCSTDPFQGPPDFTGTSGRLRCLRPRRRRRISMRLGYRYRNRRGRLSTARAGLTQEWMTARKDGHL
jgi:hypothetical protein